MPPWKWSVAVITAPRVRPTLDRTLASLQAAGFESPVIMRDEDGKGSWPTWLAALRQTLTAPDANALFICEDDVVFCRGLRSYMEATLQFVPTTGVCSPYSPAPYRTPDHLSWHKENRGWYPVGALAWALSPATGRRLLHDLSSLASKHRVDAIVGRWAAEQGLDCWYHTPSLAQHMGLGCSAIGDNNTNDLRWACDFVGEDYVPLDPAVAPLHTEWTVGPTLAFHLRKLLRPGMVTLECGSGLTARIFEERGCHHTALDHDSRFASKSPCVKMRELVGDPAWYDWQPEHNFDLVLVDGPVKPSGRAGILPHLAKLTHSWTILVCDDTNRPQDAAVADEIAKRLGFQQKEILPVIRQDFGRRGRILAHSQVLRSLYP